MSLKGAFIFSALKESVAPFQTLDDYQANTKAAFSISKLFTNATRSLQIRRSSDNSTLDIGFVNDLFDVASATAFISGGNGFVSKWYDQSGNGNDVVNATTSTQPNFILSDLSLNYPGDGRLLLKTLSQALPYTCYLYCKQNTFTVNSQYIPLGAGLNGIVQQTKGPFNELTLVSNSDWIGLTSSQTSNYALFRFTLQADGNLIGALNQEPIMGDDIRFLLGNAGTSAITKVQIGGGSSPNFNTKAFLLMDNEISNSGHVDVVNYFTSNFSPTIRPSIVSYGDSITAGTAASSPVLRYINLTAQSIGADVTNYGISGSIVGYGISVDPSNLSGLYNTTQLGYQKGYLTFCYGTNDGVQPAAWRDYYQSLIQYFITLGYDTDKICIVTPPYNSALAFLPATVAYCQQIATNLGIRYADCYTYMMNNGGDSLLADGLHPNNAGHSAMAFVVEQSFS